MKYEYSAELEPSGDSQSLWVNLCTVSESHIMPVYIASTYFCFCLESLLACCQIYTWNRRFQVSPSLDSGTSCPLPAGAAHYLFDPCCLKSRYAQAGSLIVSALG
ncbi:hypothetical protein Pelo_19690 [Pelomyxa schiedti]|nr:hypothetical protein Pelo_19690 [Pelomyxa schiedti]